MRIAIMGAGGFGSYYGARLQAGGADVTFIGRGEHLRAMQQDGLTVDDAAPLRLPKVSATDDPSSVAPVDVALVCVKLKDTAAAGHPIKPILKPGAAVISLQNGVQKDDILAPIVGPERLLGGAAYISAFVTKPGTVRKLAQLDRLAFGEYDNSRSARA